MQTIHMRIIAGILANVLAACNNDDINSLINGSAASADTQTRTRYVPGGEASQKELDRLRYLAPGQSTKAIRTVIGSPDSMTPDGDFYYTADGQMVKIVYDAAGRWTGQTEPAPAPEFSVPDRLKAVQP